MVQKLRGTDTGRNFCDSLCTPSDVHRTDRQVPPRGGLRKTTLGPEATSGYRNMVVMSWKWLGNCGTYLSRCHDEGSWARSEGEASEDLAQWQSYARPERRNSTERASGTCPSGRVTRLPEERSVWIPPLLPTSLVRPQTSSWLGFYPFSRIKIIRGRGRTPPLNLTNPHHSER